MPPTRCKYRGKSQQPFYNWIDLFYDFLEGRSRLMGEKDEAFCVVAERHKRWFNDSISDGICIIMGKSSTTMAEVTPSRLYSLSVCHIKLFFSFFCFKYDIFNAHFLQGMENFLNFFKKREKWRKFTRIFKKLKFI